jgi:RNA polymerase sigma factor (sigma-70 family)
MTTALNLCRKEHGRRARVRSGDVPERLIALSSAALEMRDALAGLPTRQREAVTLFYVGDLSIHAIAEVMNISDGAVKAHLSHGRKRLRELLDG